MKQLILLLSLLTIITPAMASDSERLREAKFAPQLNSTNASLQLKNQAVLEYLWLDVYAAAFYSEPDVTPLEALQEQTSQRLELFYFQNIDRDDVVKAAWITLERQQSAATLKSLKPELDRLHASFRDIAPGDRYALVFSKDQGMQLERNGETVFSSPDNQLAKAYMGIWLAPEGLSDDLRTALLTER